MTTTDPAIDAACLDFEERAAIAEYDGGHTRAAAERLAWQRVAIVHGVHVMGRAVAERLRRIKQGKR